MSIFTSATQMRHWAGGCLLIAMSLLGGCANRTDLIATGRVAVELHVDQFLHTPPEVYEDQGDLVIAGRLERGQPVHPGGRMDIAVIAADGAIIFDAQVKYGSTVAPALDAGGPSYAVFHRVSTNRFSWSDAYVLRFKGLPPAGSVVKVRFKPSPHVPVATPSQSQPQP